MRSVQSDRLSATEAAAGQQSVVAVVMHHQHKHQHHHQLALTITRSLLITTTNPTITNAIIAVTIDVIIIALVRMGIKECGLLLLASPRNSQTLKECCGK